MMITEYGIQSGLALLGDVTHELFHVLGRVHEQCRADRDQHIKINWNNVNKGKIKAYDILIPITTIEVITIQTTKEYRKCSNIIYYE